MKTYFLLPPFILTLFFSFSCEQSLSEQGYEYSGPGPVDTIEVQTSKKTLHSFNSFYYNFPVILLKTKVKTSNGFLQDHLSLTNLSTNETLQIKKQDFPEETRNSVIRSILPQKNSYFILFSQNQLYKLSPSFTNSFKLITKLDLPNEHFLFENAMLSIKNNRIYAVISKKVNKNNHILCNGTLKLAVFNWEGTFLDSYPIFPDSSLCKINLAYRFDLFKYQHTLEGIATVNIFQNFLFLYNETEKAERKTNIPFLPLFDLNKLPKEQLSLDDLNEGTQSLRDYTPEVSISDFIISNGFIFILIEKRKDEKLIFKYDLQKQKIIAKKPYKGQFLTLSPEGISGLFIKRTQNDKYILYNKRLVD